MGTRRRMQLLAGMLLAWVVLPPSTHAQPIETKGWAISIRAIVQPGPVQQRGRVLQLQVKDHLLFFVYRHLFPDEAEAPISEIGNDLRMLPPGTQAVELQGSEELLAGLLQEAPGQRVLELRGVYHPALRVFHLSAVQPVEQYALIPLCPPLPAMGPANQVSIHVAKEPDHPGRVCARVINRLSAEVSYGNPVARLQVWEEGWWWRPGRFADVPPDPIVMYQAVQLSLLPGEASEDRLPHSYRPTLPGRYRVCFRYEFPAWPPGPKKEVCSQEFTLP